MPRNVCKKLAGVLALRANVVQSTTSVTTSDESGFAWHSMQADSHHRDCRIFPYNRRNRPRRGKSGQNRIRLPPYRLRPANLDRNFPQRAVDAIH
jgi:hypothetical protein